MIIRELHITDYTEYLRLINIFTQSRVKDTESDITDRSNFGDLNEKKSIQNYFTEEQFIEMLKIMKNNSIIIVLELDGRLIGTGTILFEHKFIHNISKVAHIEDVCIDSEFRVQRKRIWNIIDKSLSRIF
jgi:tRNA 2-selenouridine synthase SelU